VTIKPLQDDESLENVQTTVEPRRQSDVQVSIMYLFQKCTDLGMLIIENLIKTSDNKLKYILFCLF